MSIDERRRGVRKVEVRVLDVDAARFTARVQHVRGDHPAESVPFQTPYMANRGGGWMGAVPEEGDMAVMESASGSESWRISGYISPARAETRTRVEGAVDHSFDEPRSNFAAGRGQVFPGDMGMWGSAGNRVTVRRSGVTEVVADEITWSRYFAREHTIRHSAATIETQGVFGTSSWYTVRDSAREAEGSTPTGFATWVKTHAEASPVVNFEAGAVLEDEALSLPGKPKRHTRRRGNVCGRLMVYDQPFADRYAALGRPPDPAGARLAIRFDEEGNVEWLQAGQLTQSCAGRVIHVVGSDVSHVTGSMDRKVTGGWSVEAAGQGRLHAAQSLYLGSGGDVVLDCARFVVRADNDHVRTRRDFHVTAGGSYVASASGSALLSGAAGVEITSGRGMGVTVGGRHTVDVLGAADGENTGRDVTSWGVRVHQGKAKLEALSGSFQLSIGPSVAPLATLTLHADPRAPSQVGRIELGFPTTRSGLTLSPDGAWELTGLAGGIRCDAAGRIQMGAESPAAGYLISTLTHPVDFVTGAPILGHSTLLASPSAPAPFTGAGSLGVVPPTVALPDEVAV